MEPNYLILPVYIAVSLMLGIQSNFIKPKWSGMVFFLLVCAGIVVNCWPYITWNYGIFQEIWLIAWEGSIYYLIPSALVSGAFFLIGRHGYRFVEKGAKK
jgi:hypothetical protein